MKKMTERANEMFARYFEKNPNDTLPVPQYKKKSGSRRESSSRSRSKCL